MELTRRSLLAATAATAAAGAATRALGDYLAQRYPDPAVEVVDPAFEKYRLALSAVERLGSGFRWAEGPVWFGDMRMLLFSDVSNNRIIGWNEQTGETGVFRKPSNYANGNARDRQGRLLTCEHRPGASPGRSMTAASRSSSTGSKASR